MKKLVIASLILIAGFVFAQSAGPWHTGSFAAGDTTETITIDDAKVIYFVFTDSSLAGTDSLKILWEAPTNTTVIQYAPFALHEMDQTTSTTDVSSALLIPGDATTQAYAFFPRSSDQTITGTFLIARINYYDHVTPYVNKTRFAWRYEK